MREVTFHMQKTEPPALPFLQGGQGICYCTAEDRKNSERPCGKASERGCMFDREDVKFDVRFSWNGRSCNWGTQFHVAILSGNFDTANNMYIGGGTAERPEGKHHINRRFRYHTTHGFDNIREVQSSSTARARRCYYEWPPCSRRWSFLRPRT